MNNIIKFNKHTNEKQNITLYIHNIIITIYEDYQELSVEYLNDINYS